MNMRAKLMVLLGTLVIFISFGLSSANATVETGWPAGTSNNCRNTADGFMNFELGVEGAEIESTIPGLEFTTTSGLNWRYGDIRTGNYNVYPYGGRSYRTNDNFFAWLGVTGNKGRITFTGGTANYLSVLVSTFSGVTLDAFDANGNFLANSGWATSNINTGTLTRLTVDAEGMAYVEIHDTGNYWLMDDLCTDATPPCLPVPGHTVGNHDDKIDLVFVPDEDYNGDMNTFLSDVANNISQRLGAVAPIDTNLDKFNFYYTRLQGNVASNNCGQESSLPQNFLTQCPYADAVVVLHRSVFGDCMRNSGAVGIFSAEGDVGRSFIHEGGHGIFGLRDEYDAIRDGGSGSCSTAYNTSRPLPSNIWDTQADCQNDALAQGWDSNQCYQYTTCEDAWWKLGDASLANDNDRYNDANFRFIMFDGSYFANGFGIASERRINWVFNNLPPTTTPGLPSPSNEKSIILELNISNSGLALLKSSFTVAPPPAYFPGEYIFTAKMYSTNGNLLGEYGFSDPRLVQAEMDYAGPITIGSANFTLLLPYFNNVGEVKIVDTKTGQILLSVDVSAFATTPPGNQPPKALCQSVTMATDPGLCSASSALVDAGSFDPDGDPITLVQSPVGPYGLGTTTVTLTVTDNKGASDSCTATVTVVDQEPPIISSVSASPSMLWPPNHRMIPIAVTVSPSDVCDVAPICEITLVSSNEPVNGLGDGDLSPDWEITGTHTVNLRAERSGTGSGRTYTIAVGCTDTSGNSSTETVAITVPHDER